MLELRYTLGVSLYLLYRRYQILFKYLPQLWASAAYFRTEHLGKSLNIFYAFVKNTIPMQIAFSNSMVPINQQLICTACSLSYFWSKAPKTNLAQDLQSFLTCEEKFHCGTSELELPISLSENEYPLPLSNAQFAS